MSSAHITPFQLYDLSHRETSFTYSSVLANMIQELIVEMHCLPLKCVWSHLHWVFDPIKKINETDGGRSELLQWSFP